MDHLDPEFLKHPNRVRPREGCHEPGPLFRTGEHPVQPPTPGPERVEAEEAESPDIHDEFRGLD